MRWVKGTGLVALSIALTVLLSQSLGPLPALLPLLNPGQGVWGTAGAALQPPPGSLNLKGLIAPVTVVYSAGDVPHIFARNNHDLFLVQGYLEAENRLLEMDLMRREGEGLLSQVLGPSALPTDKTNLQEGLLVGAQRTEATMRQNPQGRAALSDLQAFSQGVNLLASQEAANHQLPMFFQLLGYQPATWTPLDSLVIQEYMEKDLSMDSTPLDMAVLAHHLGTPAAEALLPVLPPNPQSPYDPGPYPAAATAPLPTQAVSLATANSAEAALQTLASGRPLFAGLMQGFDMSNNWAVDGTLTQSGKPILAGDPHLDLTLPSIWYEIQLNDPHFDVSGVALPGTPGVLIGHNQNVAWSLTDTQDQQTFYYVEKTSPSHPGAYLFGGQWVPFQNRTYQIPVKGQKPLSYTVHWTNNGPLLTSGANPIAMDWTGDLASQDFVTVLLLDQAKNLQDYKQALSFWSCPVHNFAFADTSGDIALMAPGFYAQFSHGNPALPMDGSGPDEWTGSIPFSQVPQEINPPWHFIWSANQRPVTAQYPYYIGTSFDGFDPGYRADTIKAFLANPQNQPFTVATMERLQGDNQDHLAQILAPYIVQAGKSLGLTGPVGQEVAAFANWQGTMTENSVQASIYYFFLNHYVEDTFGPWWTYRKVPVKQYPDLQLNGDFTPLVEDLETWTEKNTPSPWFNDPLTGETRTRDQVMAQALKDALKEMTSQLGSDPTRWRWGRIHSRIFDSLTGVAALARGPYPSSGDFYTPNAAQPSLTATHGPSWRMIVDLGNFPGSVAIYPGGQSENPLSPYYADGLPLWLNFRYRPLVFLSTPPQGSATTVYQP